MLELPTQHELFDRFFRPFLSREMEELRPHKSVFPDISRMGPLDAATRDAAKPHLILITANENIVALERRARDAWPGQYGVNGPIDIRWVVAFDTHFSARAVKSLISRADSTVESSEYVKTALEFGVVLAATFRCYVSDLTWSYEQPIYDSALYDPRTETRINVFHWAIKKLSSYGVSDGYPQKVCACLQWLRGDRSRLRALADLAQGAG